MSTEIGKILGTEDAQPLDFWMAVAPDQLVQLDDVVFVTRPLPGGGSRIVVWDCGYDEGTA